jgi:hypothetical protein
MMTMLDRVILHAADDKNFRKALLADPDAALASMDYALNDYEHAALAEYLRVANRMAEQQLPEVIRDYSAAVQGHAFAGM